MRSFEEILEIKDTKEKKLGISFESYEEFLERNKTYSGKCFVHGCTKPGLYEGGDSRFYCGMCEDHAKMKNKYIREMESIFGLQGRLSDELSILNKIH